MKERRYIVVDEISGKPMSFWSSDEDNGGQFCFVNRYHPTKNFALTTYTKKEFERLVRASNKFRKANNFSLTKYIKMRVL